MEEVYSCHKIAGGVPVAGEVLFSRDPVCFYLIDPQTGRVIEKEHCLYGQCVTGKILVFPYGKASSVVQAARSVRSRAPMTAPKRSPNWLCRSSATSPSSTI